MFSCVHIPILEISYYRSLRRFQRDGDPKDDMILVVIKILEDV
jgi:hypothetical protein